MTPNLRLNKKLTRQLINSSPKEDDKSSMLTINWNIDNQTKVFGSYYQGWFKSTMFFLQKIEEDRFRLVVSDGNPLCKFFLIDNIEEYLETIGAQILDMENKLNIPHFEKVYPYLDVKELQEYFNKSNSSILKAIERMNKEIIITQTSVKDK